MIDKETYESVAPLLTATENPLPSPIFSIPYQIPSPIRSQHKNLITGKKKKDQIQFLFQGKSKNTVVQTRNIEHKQIRV